MLRIILFILVIIVLFMVVLAAFNQELWAKLMEGFGKTLIPLGFIIAFLLIAIFLFIRVFQFSFSPWSMVLLMIVLILLAILFYYIFAGKTILSSPRVDLSLGTLLNFFQSASPIAHAPWFNILLLFLTISVITGLILAPLNARLLIKLIFIGFFFFLLYWVIVSLLPIPVDG